MSKVIYAGPIAPEIANDVPYCTGECPALYSKFTRPTSPNLRCAVLEEYVDLHCICVPKVREWGQLVRKEDKQ